MTTTWISDLAIDSITSTTLYASTMDGGVFKSTNSGENWVAFNTGLATTWVNVLAIDPSMPNILYAGTGGSSVFAIQDLEHQSYLPIISK